MARLFHVRDKNLQSSTFTANPRFDQESGAALFQEDDTTEIDFDGTASWQVHIIHVPQRQTLFHVGVDEIFETAVEETFTLLNEAGENILSERNDTWPTPLIHV